jgi:twitching motility protein PilU
MEQSIVEGCQTFDTALYSLCDAGRISKEEALRAADSPNNLRLRLERIAGGVAGPAEVPLRLVTNPETQVRRQTQQLQAQKQPPAATKSSGGLPAASAERPKR